VWLRDKHGKPWQFTPEQARFVLWYFALDPESGDFLYHSAVLQRLKGWGKDPLAACLAVAAMFADVTFDHWDGDIPVGRDEPNAWVQIVAVSLDQTKNTMKLMPSLISVEARRHYGIQVGKENIYGLGDSRAIHAVTSSPLSLEGPRPTLVVRNETQNWLSSNGGHDMAGTIEGNAAKSENGMSRMLDICNAYRPAEDSVAERVRTAWEATQGESPEAYEFGLMYDSLEAPPEAPLTVDAAPSVVESIRGDAIWLSVKRITASILNQANAASESRRKWYNQITAAEDARFDPNQVKACAVPDALEIGDEIVLFGDGSKSDDATGIVAVRVSDGLAQTLHVQQPKKGQIVDRAAVDYAVTQAFDMYRPVAFWFDPSHAKDGNAEGDESFWQPLCDEWMSRYVRARGRTARHRHPGRRVPLLPSGAVVVVAETPDQCPACAEQIRGVAAEGQPRVGEEDRPCGLCGRRPDVVADRAALAGPEDRTAGSGPSDRPGVIPGAVTLANVSPVLLPPRVA
jgi:hypothetical protein